MRAIFVTGSSEGLGLMVAQRLIGEGHRVTLHARSEARAREARRGAPGAEAVVTGDVSTLEGTRSVAEQLNAHGGFDAVVHNVGIGPSERSRVDTADDLSQMFAVNVLAPYLLTALIRPPRRLIYLSSGLHRSGRPDLTDAQWRARPWNGNQAYSDSKLFVVWLAFAIARRWPSVFSNTVEPGWVATRMGGPGAPDDLALGSVTQAWLAVSDEPAACVTGQNFFHQKPQRLHLEAHRVDLQDALLGYCAKLSGTTLPVTA